MRRTLLLFLFIGIFFPLDGIAQADRISQIRNKLTAMEIEYPGLSERVELTVNEIPISQFIRGLGINHNLNINVSSDLKEPLTTNFSNAKVSDVLIFLCEEYSLDINFGGSIMSINRYIEPEKAKPPKTPYIPDVSYDKADNTLSVNLKNDSLEAVVKRITEVSSKNVLLSPSVVNLRVTAYLTSDFDEAIEKIAFTTGLVVEREGNFYLLKKGESKIDKNSNDDYPEELRSIKGEFFEFNIDDQNLITIAGRQVEIAELIDYVSEKAGIAYLLYNPPAGKANLSITNIDYDKFLDYILAGTECTYRVYDGVYLIGKADKDLLVNSELVRLNNRIIDNVIASLPEELTSGLVIKEFADLNALILSGAHAEVQRTSDFIRKLDQPVPVVLIEVLIVDYNKSRSVSGGITAGVGGGPPVSGGSLTPGVNFNLNSASINSLINSFNGFGVINLGSVTSDFYLNIQALEEEGILRTRSTPKLSTLNGTEAVMSIGNTEYYLEVTSQVIGTQNPTIQTQQNYKSVTADLEISIKPIVTGNDEVTLQIKVTQSDFTPRISDTAPPGNVSRTFDSKVRIQNGDLILLGGLENNSTEKSGSGIPFLSRIPGLKWLFGRRTNSKSESKLNIFIKSTVLR